MRRVFALPSRHIPHAEEARRAVSKHAARLGLALLLTVSISPAFAVNPGEQLADPALEARARDLGAELRCMVCQNQSIDDSDAPLAKDLRLLVRERVQAGDSEQDVLDFLVARYGDFVLLRPRFRLETLLLWGFAPFLLVTGLLGYAVWAFRARRAGRGENGLTDEENGRLEALLAREAKADQAS